MSSQDRKSRNGSTRMFGVSQVWEAQPIRRSGNQFRLELATVNRKNGRCRIVGILSLTGWKGCKSCKECRYCRVSDQRK